MDLPIGDLSSCSITWHGANMPLIKLSLIKVFLILLARLIDFICLSSTIGCDLYLVNELIDLAPVYLEESKRILTCCPFNLASSGHSLGRDGNVLANVWRGGGWMAVDCTLHSARLRGSRVDSAFCSLSESEEVALAMTLLKCHFSVTFKLGGGGLQPAQNPESTFPLTQRDEAIV